MSTGRRGPVLCIFARTSASGASAVLAATFPSSAAVTSTPVRPWSV
jgi:hypothetical protein